VTPIGIRFNVLSGKIYPLQQLGLEGNFTLSCTNGNERFTVNGPPASETPAGATICGGVTDHGALYGIAFNPATGYLASIGPLDKGVLSPVSCTNSNDGNNVAICTYLSERVEPTTSSIPPFALYGVAFDPRTGFKSADVPLFGAQALFGHAAGRAAGAFISHPACTTADNSGQVICAIRGSANTLLGFAFDPRSNFVTALRTLDSSNQLVHGTPSCSGLNDGSNQVICALNAGPPNTDMSNIVAVKFDPRTGATSGLANTGFVSGMSDYAREGQTVQLTGPLFIDLSCTFQNINPKQVTCGGVVTGQNDFFGIVLTPPIPPNPIIQ
jgi:hypothetical protein